MIDNDPAILSLKSRCTTLETNGNLLEERVKGLQTALNEQIPPPVIQEFRDVSAAIAAESSKTRELAQRFEAFANGSSKQAADTVMRFDGLTFRADSVEDVVQKLEAHVAQLENRPSGSAGGSYPKQLDIMNHKGLSTVATFTGKSSDYEVGLQDA